MSKIIRSITETLIFPEGTNHNLIPFSTPPCKPLRDAGICFSGISDTPEGYIVERRRPGNHELLYTLEGEGYLESGKRVVTVGPSDLMVLPGNAHYRYGVAAGQWRILWFHLESIGLWSSLEGMQPHVRGETVKRDVLAAAEGLLTESLRNSVGAGRLVSLFAEQIVLYLAREVSADDKAHDRRMRQLLDGLLRRLNEALQRDWDVRNMADQLQVSPAQFHRVCLRYLGKTPKNVLRDLRMRRAEDLLIHYDHPLASIADEVGYGSPYAFSNAFKRHTGISPKAYRSSLLTNRRQISRGGKTSS